MQFVFARSDDQTATIEISQQIILNLVHRHIIKNSRRFSNVLSSFDLFRRSNLWSSVQQCHTHIESSFSECYCCDQHAKYRWDVVSGNELFTAPAASELEFGQQRNDTILLLYIQCV